MFQQGGYGYCGCNSEPFYPTYQMPYRRGGYPFALVLVLFILLVIIGASRF